MLLLTALSVPSRGSLTVLLDTSCVSRDLTCAKGLAFPGLTSPALSIPVICPLVVYIHVLLKSGLAGSDEVFPLPLEAAPPGRVGPPVRSGQAGHGRAGLPGAGWRRQGRVTEELQGANSEKMAWALTQGAPWEGAPAEAELWPENRERNPCGHRREWSRPLISIFVQRGPEPGTVE